MMNNRVTSDGRAFENKLAAYAVAGAAALASSTNAQAAIVYTANVNQTVTETGSYSFNLSGPAAADITVSAEVDPYVGAFNNVDASANTGAGILLDPSGGLPVAQALAFGALIDPASAASFGSFGKMASSFSSSPGDWSSTGGDSYLGIYFTDATGSHAGWADIQTTANSTASSFEVLSFAYETVAGQSITAGQTADVATAVPEPPAILLLAMGAVGMAAVRRRRRLDA